MEVEDKREKPLPILINLRTLRLPLTKKGDHLAFSKVSISGNRIILKQEFKEGSYYCGSAIVIEVVGRQTLPTLESESTARLSIESGNKPFTVLMASAATFNSEQDVIELATKNLEDALLVYRSENSGRP